MKMPAKVQNNFNTNKLIYKIMEKVILKQAKLTNSGVWTTTITWYSLGSSTQIVTKQCYTLSRKNNYTRVENYTEAEFDKAYNDFHKMIAKWI